MRRFLSLLLAATVIVGLGASALAGDAVRLTVWGAEGDQRLLDERIGQFKAAYPDQSFEIELEAMDPSAAGDAALTDAEIAADVYAFPDGQLSALAAAGALLPLDYAADQTLRAVAGKSLEDVKAANAAPAVEAAARDGVLYAFPMGVGGGCVLYYDDAVVSAEQAQSWDGLLDAAAAAGKKVGVALSSDRYSACFFLGAGFAASPAGDDSAAPAWNGVSASGVSGVQVVRAMRAVSGSAAFMAVPEDGLSDAIRSGDLAAVVAGVGDAGTAEESFSGYAAAKLPAFTVDDRQVQMGCLCDFALMGVNAYSENVGWAVVLAEFLTNERSQLARFKAGRTIPANLAAAADPAVAEDAAAAAAAAQYAFGAARDADESRWEAAASLGGQIVRGELGDDDAAVQAVLDRLAEGAGAG